MSTPRDPVPTDEAPSSQLVPPLPSTATEFTTDNAIAAAAASSPSPKEPQPQHDANDDGGPDEEAPATSPPATPTAATCCEDLPRLLCRLIDIRVAITNYYLSEKDHYERKQRQLVGLLHDVMESTAQHGGDEPGRGGGDAQARLMKVVEKGYAPARRPEALVEDIAQVGALEAAINKAISKGSGVWSKLPEDSQVRYFATEVEKLETRIRRVEQDIRGIEDELDGDGVGLGH